jgi:hypothetical protein
MPQTIVCHTCGTVVEVPGQGVPSSSEVASAGPDVASTAITANRPGAFPPAAAGETGLRIDLRAVVLAGGYVLAGACVVLLFVLGIVRFNDKASIFWIVDEFGVTLLRYVKDEAFVFAALPLAVAVAGALAATRVRGLMLGAVLAAAAVAAYCGVLHYRKEADWGERRWFYDALVGAGLLAIFMGLVFSKRWLVLAWFIPCTVGLAFAGRYLNRGPSPGPSDWIPFFAGAFHGMVLGLIARVVAWCVNRARATVLLGALIGGLAGLLLVDVEHWQILNLLRIPELRLWKMPFISLYGECAGALLGGVIFGVLGRPQRIRSVVRTYRRRRSAAVT